MVHCGFQPSKCRITHFQPQIWSTWPIFPNDSESVPKVCYINWKNSEILSKLGNSEPGGVSTPAIFWSGIFLWEGVGEIKQRQWCQFLRWVANARLVGDVFHQSWRQGHKELIKIVIDVFSSNLSCGKCTRTPWIVKGNKSLNLVWFKWGLQSWGILKHFPQSRCILISHWSREK